MEFFKPGSLNIDFVGRRRPFILLSVAMVVVAIAVVIWRQASDTMNWGIDFAGGTVIDLGFEKDVDIGAVRKAVTDLGYQKNVIQRSGLARRRWRAWWTRWASRNWVP
jgi:preprotein translocase subunit SecF